MANPAITALLGNKDAQRKAPFDAFYFSFLPKEPGFVLPAIILDRLHSPDAAETLDKGSALPGGMIEGVFQFGSVAEDNPKNPAVPSGYLSAVLLSQAIRRQLMQLATGDSVLPGGVIINDVHILDEYDAHYELGGQGYLIRRVLQARIFFKEVA